MVTEIFRIDGERLDEFSAEISFPASKIREGGLVVFPTETVYGLGGDATNPEAARRIFSAKGRPSDNPLIIHVSKPEDAEKYAVTSRLYYRLAEKYMPGPLTVILESKDSIPLETRGGLSTVAVRCPENKIARRLIECSGVPIAAPSANLSGSPSPTSASHVIDDMMGRVDVIIDGGECDFGLESTIVKIDGDGLTLLRPGKITPEELSLMCDVSIAGAVVDKLADGERALSPGMKYRHYAPASPVVLLDGGIEEQTAYIKADAKGRIAIICYTEDREMFSKSIPNAKIYELGGREDVASQAHALFAILREADKDDFYKIYAPLPDKHGIGLAIYNRMIRAAAHTIIKLGR